MNIYEELYLDYKELFPMSLQTIRPQFISNLSRSGNYGLEYIKAEREFIECIYSYDELIVEIENKKDIPENYRYFFKLAMRLEARIKEALKNKFDAIRSRAIQRGIKIEDNWTMYNVSKMLYKKNIEIQLLAKEAEEAAKAAKAAKEAEEAAKAAKEAEEAAKAAKEAEEAAKAAKEAEEAAKAAKAKK